MTPKRKQEIKHKLGCADVWDRSKSEFWQMLFESMEYIEELERRVTYNNKARVRGGIHRRGPNNRRVC